jgi:hypothetical protein
MSDPSGSRHTTAWRADPDAVAPVVLVLGGFLTSPPLYLPLAWRLRRRGVADVVIGRVWTPDWLLAAGRGLGPNLRRAGHALLRAGERSIASPLAGGAPVLVVGHSAGGMLGRLLTSPVPFEGLRLGAVPRIGALVTLGTPHHTSPRGDIGGRVGSVGSAFADEVIPGAAFAPRVGYVTVASRAIVGAAGGDRRARTALRFYRGLLAEDRASVEGDGLIPVESALLEGAMQIVLDDVVHGQFGGQPWYGSEEVIDAWWPAALEAWHAALQVRVSEAPGGRAGGRRSSDGGPAVPI